MSPLLRPVGSLPASIYWVRRILALLLVGLLLWTLGALVVSGQGSERVTTASTGPEAQAGGPGDAHGRADNASGQVSRSGNRRLTCETPTVTMALPGDSFTSMPAGRPLKVEVTYVNWSDEACQVLISWETLRVMVISGHDRIWDTADCPRRMPTAPLLLQPGRPHTLTITWPGRRSAPGCPSNGDVALPGYYAAELIVDGVSVDQERFRLT